jgi:uncharacterized RDD family membrane protein YckC
LRYAGLWPRFLALVLDTALFCVVFFPITRLVKGVWLMSAGDHQWAYGWFITDPLCLTFLGIIVVYFVVLEGLAGATVGKWLVGLRVVTPDGHKPGLSKGLLRNVLRVVDTLPALNILGVVLIACSPERARLGDRVAGTRVIHAR